MSSRHWIITRSGKAFDFDAPSVDALDIGDIAHALANQCRFNGHVMRFYSVAEHCVRVAQECLLRMPEEPLAERLAVAKWGLLHDAAEAYVGDCVAPLKQRMRMYSALAVTDEGEFDIIEASVMTCVREKFGLAGNEPVLVKHLDRVLCATEIRDLLPPAPRPLGFEVEPLAELIGPTWQPEEAKGAFLDMFYRLERVARADYVKPV